MFRIFKRTIKVEFLYSDLNPNDRIRKILITHILPDLEPIGFNLLKSELTLKRDIGDFQQTIHFQKSKWNNANDICKFMVHVSIYSNALKRHQRLNDCKTNGDVIISQTPQNMSCWDKEFLDQGWYDLVKFDNLKIVESIKNNLLQCGIEFFKNSESETGLVDFIMSMNSSFYMTPTLFDICKMYNKKEKAIELLSWLEKIEIKAKWNLTKIIFNPCKKGNNN